MQSRVAMPTLVVYLFLRLFHSDALAYREYFTPEQRAQLERIQTILVEVIALTDKGSVPSDALAGTIVQRL